MNIRTDFPFKIAVTEDQRITLPDGTDLSARLWRPESQEPVPLILEFLPYRKRDGTIARDEMMHPWYAGHGYACLRVDMRGNGESGGLMEDEYTAQELQDACDVIAWARAQPWCTGKVGMQGISWGGFNALQVAALQPEGLEAIITICSTVDRYADDIHYKGGCLLGENFGWASQMWSYSSRPPDPALVGDQWREMWRARLEAQPFLLSTWLRHQHRDAYWEHGSVCEDYSRLKAKVLSVGGWADGYRNTIAHLVENVPGTKGIVGPWNHKYPFYAGPEPRIGFLQEAKRWWDRWLKGIETGVEDDPDMRLWLMYSLRPKPWFDARPGQWIAEPDWTQTEIKSQSFVLTQDGSLNAELPTAPRPFEIYVNSPAHCGAAAGEFFPFAFDAELPVDQRQDDAFSACFDADVAQEECDIVGAPNVRLRLTPEGETGLVAVRLTDVFPDGTSAMITWGYLNLCHHESHASPEALTPGAPIDVTLTLDQIAYRLPAGHRLRLAVSTQYWPTLWPPAHAKGLTITGGALSLPVRPTATDAEWRFEPPETSPPWDHEVLRAASYARDQHVDMRTGTQTLRFTMDNGLNRDLAHGLASGSGSVETWTIGEDPLSAQAEITWEQELRRDDWDVRTQTSSNFWCDATHFHFKATLTAYIGDDVFFEKTLTDAIPRDLI
ncbi:CocE/NonD family hydrolase [Primorskyibacter sp. S187A]|uniref:CocE/NonD family hydrolase n=1 Tax=Primorskyibacter sp. S187A TaxID=3415130 RepID=UPI003C7E6FFD